MDMANHPLLAIASSDPPPFPANYLQLRRLDRSVVCQICKEPFQGPVSIACGHSFCSQCIRSALDVSKKCPTCDQTVSEGSIRRNRALEEITDAWDESRPTLITLTLPQPARRRPPAEPPSKPSSSSSLNKRSRRASGSRHPSPNKARKLSEDVLEIPDSDDVEPEDGADLEELNENDEGSCPLCSAHMPIAAIPMHIERGCPPVKVTKVNGKGNQKADWKKVFAGAGTGKEKEVEMKRIVKPNYHLTTDKDLRAMLSEHGLQTVGDHEALVSRIQQWILLFNSNLDTSHPRSLSALRAKLNEAESSRKRDREKGKEDAVAELGTKEGMQKYAKDKKGEFERMRKEIIERDRKRAEMEKGSEVESPIEVD